MVTHQITYDESGHAWVTMPFRPPVVTGFRGESEDLLARNASDYWLRQDLEDIYRTELRRSYPNSRVFRAWGWELKHEFPSVCVFSGYEFIVAISIAAVPNETQILSMRCIF